MNPYQFNLILSYLFTGFVLLGLALFVYFKNKYNPVNRSFSVYSINIAWWSLTSVFIITAQNEAMATFFCRICLMGAVLIPTTFVHFTLTLLNQARPIKNFIRMCYFVSFCFIILNFTPFIVKETAPVYFVNYFTVPGIGYYFFLAYFVSMAAYGIYLLYRGFKNATEPHRQQQFLYLFWGTLLGYIGGSLNYNLALRIPPYWTVPWGTCLVGIYGIIVTVAIVKHHLMDISIVIKKSIIYSVSIATTSLIYLLTVFTLEKVVQGLFGYTSLVISIGSAFALGLLFFPIRYKIQYLMDHYFFRGTPDEIATQNAQLRQDIAQTEKYRTLSTLATGIAHEIKNPLTAIRTFTEYLPQKLDDKEFLKKFSRIVGREVSRIDDMVHDLLEYGKPAPLSLKKTFIHKLINDTLEVLSSQFLSQKISVVRHLAPGTQLLTIDPVQIKQALLNIFLNAIEAMPKGGTLTVATSVSRTSYFIIEIEDTGCGIPREDLSRIFDPYFSRKDQGTGLGLSITQSLIENHKGIIQIRSKVGMGTVVRIDLPC